MYIFNIQIFADVNKYDIGLYVGKKLSDAEKFDIIEHLWSPDENFKFPTTQEGTKVRNKQFKYSWLQTFGWLAYSKLYDGKFCVPCVFFGHEVRNSRSACFRNT